MATPRTSRSRVFFVRDLPPNGVTRRSLFRCEEPLRRREIGKIEYVTVHQSPRRRFALNGLIFEARSVVFAASKEGEVTSWLDLGEAENGGPADALIAAGFAPGN